MLICTDDAMQTDSKLLSNRVYHQFVLSRFAYQINFKLNSGHNNYEMHTDCCLFSDK